MLPRNYSGTPPSYLSVYLAICLVFAFVTTSHASPTFYDLSRRGANITYDASGHIINVTDPLTMAPIDQGDATDGSGSGFNVPAIVWVVWAFATGVPLMLAGIRLGRLTTGVAIGLAITVCSTSLAALLQTLLR